MGRFTYASTDVGLSGRPDGRPTYGVTFADYDNDGDRDVFVANFRYAAYDHWGIEELTPHIRKQLDLILSSQLARQ